MVQAEVNTRANAHCCTKAETAEFNMAGLTAGRGPFQGYFGNIDSQGRCCKILLKTKIVSIVKY